MINALALLIFLPFFGGLAGWFSSRFGTLISAGSTFIAFAISLTLLLSFQHEEVIRWEWLPGFELSILVDSTGLLLTSLVTFIALLIQVFSAEYLKNDEGKNRYFSKLGLFITSMIGLLMADHLILLFIFWELVGLSSYLLIGFWYRKSGVSKSAMTAFLVNRVADAALLVGILLTYNEVGTLSISELKGTVSWIASFSLVIGAFGKSAQFPFSSWLIKAMVGPTPVSALIHAATMVAAGVYLLFRLAPILTPEVSVFIAIIGTVTAFYAALSAIAQFDLKRVLAYSTISQLGYMMLGIGVGAREAALFHLFTHAFFKAGLFLGAAAIIHHLQEMNSSDPQDMRTMGGLRNTMPVIFSAFIGCGMALAGLPLFSGFMSKDGILIGAWNFAIEAGGWAYLIPDVALITALLTAFYVGRMIILIFFGKARGFEGADNLGSNYFKVPMILLSLFSIWIFHNWNPLAHDSLIFDYFAISGVHLEGGELIPFLAAIVALVGLVLAYSFFKPGTTYMARITEIGNPASIGGSMVYRGLLLSEVYDKIGEGVVWFSKSLSRIDQSAIDLAVHFVAVFTVVFSKIIALFDRFFVDGPVNFIASVSGWVGKRLAGLSARDAQTQIIWLLIILLLILTSIIILQY